MLLYKVSCNSCWNISFPFMTKKTKMNTQLGVKMLSANFWSISSGLQYKIAVKAKFLFGGNSFQGLFLLGSLTAALPCSPSLGGTSPFRKDYC